MKLKDLEKVTKIYELIKPIDADLIRLDKLAQSVANGDSVVKLSLDSINLRMKESMVKENLFTEDGDLNLNPKLSNAHTGLNYDWNTGTVSEIKIIKPAFESCYIQDLSDVLTLEMLGMLIRSKQEQKKMLLNKLIKYKITA